MGTRPRLSVNINKIATLRNARGGGQPNVQQVGRDVLGFGAHGITVHPRPDGRHIVHQDVIELAPIIRQYNQGNVSSGLALRQVAKHRRPTQVSAGPRRKARGITPRSSMLGDLSQGQLYNHDANRRPMQNVGRELNVEGYPAPEFLQLIERVRPHQCTLVPDGPNVLTSNAGWALQKSQAQLQPVLESLKNKGVRSSLFVDPFAMNEGELQALQSLAPDRVELYTQAYAERPECVGTYSQWAEKIARLGIAINAGHDLNQTNLAALLRAVPQIEEVSIGHALICEALYDGLERTIHNYLKIVEAVQVKEVSASNNEVLVLCN